MNIHLVYPGQFQELKACLEENNHLIVGWDFTLEQFAVFSDQKETFAEVALIDGTAGVVKKQEVIDHLKKIRMNFPDLRIVLQLPMAAKADQLWINQIIGLAIYDLHFVDEFDDEDVERWLQEKMTLANHMIDLKKVEGMIEGSPEYKEKDSINQEGLLHRLFGKQDVQEKDSSKRKDTVLDILSPKNLPLPITTKKLFGNLAKEGGRATYPMVMSPQMILIYGGKGGSGVTTIALHLAAHFKAEGTKVGVLDLGFPYGHMGAYLNIGPSPSAQRVTEGDFYFSDNQWQEMTVENKGIRYFLPPHQWEEGFLYDSNLIEKMIRNMQRCSTITITDMSNQHSIEAQQMAFRWSSKIYWVIENNSASIYHARRLLNLFRHHGIQDEGKIELILNRVQGRDFDQAIIEQTLGKRVVLEIPYKPEIPTLMNKGTILAKGIDELYDLVQGSIGTGRKGLFRFLRG